MSLCERCHRPVPVVARVVWHEEDEKFCSKCMRSFDRATCRLCGVVRGCEGRGVQTNVTVPVVSSVRSVGWGRFGLF